MQAILQLGDELLETRGAGGDEVPLVLVVAFLDFRFQRLAEGTLRDAGRGSAKERRNMLESPRCRWGRPYGLAACLVLCVAVSGAGCVGDIAPPTSRYVGGRSAIAITSPKPLVREDDSSIWQS